MATEDVFGIVGTTQAGNFHVEQAVAEGGFGVVYRAQHGAFRAPVALKCLKIPEEMSQRQREIFLEKFREEAELLFRLSASIPEVVRPLHVDVLVLKDGGFVPFLAMEWLEGESLDAIITKRADQGLAPLGLHKLIKLLRPVVHALSRAHRFIGPQGTESIVHRDLKPENIFIATIGGAESVKILDFGIAKARRLASEAAGRLTGQQIEEDEGASFTPAYGAPEQWAPKRFGATGPWTDVWGMALTMVEVLTGGPAIDGDNYAMRRMTLDDKRRPTPRALGAVVTDAVEQVFERAMAVDPRRRTADMETFWTELERAMGITLSFVSRDQRREDGDEPISEEITSSSPGRASSPGGAPPAPVTPAPGATRLARIELQRIAVPVDRPSASAQQLAPPPASSPSPLSSDFSDVFALSEHAPRLAAPAESAPRAAQVPSPVGSQAGPLPSIRRPMDSLEFDLDPVAGSIRRPAGVDLTGVACPTPNPPPRSDRGARLEQARASIDLELSLPTESSPGSDPRPGRAPASERARPPRAMSSEDNLEANLEMAPGSAPRSAPRSARRPPSRPEQEIPLEVAPKSARRPPGRPREMAPISTRRPHPGNLPAELGSEGNAELRQLGARIRGPLWVLSIAIAISLAEIAYTRITGTPLMLGPVRPFWIAAPLAVFGVAFTLWRFMGDRDDG